MTISPQPSDSQSDPTPSAEVEALRTRYNVAIANGLWLHAQVLLRRLVALEQQRATSSRAVGE